MRFVISIIVLGLIAGVVYMASNLIPASGVFANLEPLLVEKCERIDVAPGTEDATIDPDTNLVYVSAGDRRAWFQNDGGPHAATNGIYAFSLDDPSDLRRVSVDGPTDFLPHGISLWRGPEGAKRLFVVNHPQSGEEIVEIFDVEADGGLRHIESISFDAMHSPNDVVAVGPRQFYATNDKGYKEGLMSTLEAYLALPFSSVAYFDGAVGSLAAKGLVYANGINKSADGKTIYVAEFLGRKIRVFDRDADTGALVSRRTIAVNTGPDNIEVAEDGALWIGGHSKVFDFLKHAEDASAIAPSHVIRVDPETGASRDVFVSTKGEINGSSVGAVWNDALIVGAVFDGWVMKCPLE